MALITVQGRVCRVGVDVSMYQGVIDWETAKRHVDYAYIKATEGSGYIDPRSYANFAGARAAGLPFGAYHFARPNGDVYDADVEARWFWDNIKSAGFTLPPALDIESTALDRQSTTLWVLQFCEEIARLSGVQPVIYTGAYFSMNRPPELAAYDLWLAAYTANYNPDPNPSLIHGPPSCAPWGTDWSIWQYTSSGHVPGIGGSSVDMNVATIEWLDRVLGTHPAPTQPLTKKGPGMAIVYFHDKSERWLFGHDGNDYFFHYIDSLDELALLEAIGLPVVELGAKAGGTDWLDATFHRITGR